MSGTSDSIETADRYGTPAERATLLISVASASVAFMLAFNLGAYGEIFFDQIFTVFIAGIAESGIDQNRSAQPVWRYRGNAGAEVAAH